MTQVATKPRVRPRLVAGPSLPVQLEPAMKSILKEPLLHFLLIGAALFLVCH